MRVALVTARAATSYSNRSISSALDLGTYVFRPELAGRQADPIYFVWFVRHEAHDAGKITLLVNVENLDAGSVTAALTVAVDLPKNPGCLTDVFWIPGALPTGDYRATILVEGHAESDEARFRVGERP